MRNLSAVIMPLCVACVAQAASITFPAASGDISSNGSDGWNGTMPTMAEIARFATANGRYIAADDVEFGSLAVMANGTQFNLDTDGNHTVKASNVYLGYHNVAAAFNGGVWDMSVATSANSNVPARQFAACNQDGVRNTTATLAKGCIVTNAASIRLGYNAGGNKLKITDGSRVYAGTATLCNNPGAMNCTLEVSSGGVLTLLTGNFNDTAATSSAYLVPADTTNRVVITGAGSKIVNPSSGASQGFSIGTAYGRNSLLVADGGELVAPLKFRIGASANANGNIAVFDAAKGTLNNVVVGESDSCGNALFVSNSTFKCNKVEVSSSAAACSNAFYIAGSDTDFTVRVSNLPRYPFSSCGAYNTFEMSDGAEWRYWLNMQLDDKASSNTIRFVRGARMHMEGGLFSGTNHMASCGNRVYVGDGARLEVSFVYISRRDNVFTVSNATITASSTASSWNGLRFGYKLANVDEAGIGGNGLIVQGDAPEVSAAGDVSFARASFLRFAIPSGAYAAGCVPLTARKLSLDTFSSLEIDYPQGRVAPGLRMLVSTTGGITLPEAVLAAANASLAAQSGGMARLALANGGNDLVMRIEKGMSVSFR